MSGKNILLFSRERKGFRFNNVWVWALMRLEILSYGENIKETDNLPNNSEVFPRNIKCGYLILPLPRVMWFLHYSPQNICRLYQNSVLWLHLHRYEHESSLLDIYGPMRYHNITCSWCTGNTGLIPPGILIITPTLKPVTTDDNSNSYNVS